ncbi:MAG: T9SS type A sorting domain-containing protein [Pedobacter sp.]|nr:MAG: T9SS type A sorting domain-containing protein [Pedobacter sp.]
MKKITSLFLTLALMFFCSLANAQTTNNAQRKRHSATNFFMPHIAKEKAEKNNQQIARNKKAIGKNVATYTYVGVNQNNGQVNDTMERYKFTWNSNGIPTKVLSEGVTNGIIPGQNVSYRITFTDFVKVNPVSGSEFDWIVEGADFDAKNAIGQVSIGNKWVDFMKFSKTINAQGQVEEYIESSSNGFEWTVKSKEIYKYNAAGIRTENVEQEWKDNKWVNSYKSTEFLDADGLELGYQDELWDTDSKSWMIEDGSKKIVTKNASNQITAIEQQWFDEQSNDYFSFGKQVYTYNASGAVTQVTDLQNYDGDWYETMRYKNISWKSFDAKNLSGDPIMLGGGKYTKAEAYSFSEFDQDWIITQKYINIFTGNNITESAELYSNGTDWDTIQKSTFSFYPNGDEKETIFWNNNMGTWEINYGYGSNNTYDTDGDLLTSKNLNWDFDENAFVENSMEIYTYTTETTGINENNAKATSLSVYPNPTVNGNITIDLGKATLGAVTIIVYDNAGKIASQNQYSANGSKLTLDFNNLPKGLYHISAIQNQNVQKAHFVIQ